MLYVKMTRFLDGRLGIEYHYVQANYKSVFVQNILLKFSFVLNNKKSIREQCKNITKKFASIFQQVY